MTTVITTPHRMLGNLLATVALVALTLALPLSSHVATLLVSQLVAMAPTTVVVSAPTLTASVDR